MEQSEAKETNLTTVKPKSVASLSVICLKTYPHLLQTMQAQVKSLPKLEPVVAVSSSMPLDAMVSSPGGARAESSSPSVLQLSDNGSSEDTSKQCRACNPRHPKHESYAEKKAVEFTEGDSDPFVVCVHCMSWFHCECVTLEPFERAVIASFSCPSCSPEHGPSREKAIVAPHRIRYYDMHEIGKPIEVATASWVAIFKEDEATKFAPPPPELVVILDTGSSLETQFDMDSEWKKIYFIKDKSGLGLTMPETGEIYIDELIEILGDEKYVDTIEVYRQLTVQMSLGRYRKLLNSSDRRRLYNILSLEFSNSELAKRVGPPSIVKKLSWVERYWFDWSERAAPDTLPSGLEETCDHQHYDRRPRVELFALLGMGGSFTDFHVDFGGSSVWYHVYKGRKIFYIVEPTPKNLEIYEKHQNIKHGESFLGDEFGDKCYRVVIEEGQTLLMPAGWIHAVYTPVDSLVFGGNFLTNLNVDLQCQIYAHELHCNMETRFVFPHFELVNWYAARTFTEIIREYNDDQCLPPLHLMRGAKALVDALSEWTSRDKASNDEEKQQAVTRKFIHGHSQTYILNALKKEYGKMETRMSPEVRARVEFIRMRRKMERVEMKTIPTYHPLISVKVPDSRLIGSLGPFRPQMSTQTQRIQHRYSMASSTVRTLTPVVRPRLSEGPASLLPTMTGNPMGVRRDLSTASKFSFLSTSANQSPSSVLISKRTLGDKIGMEMKNGPVPEGRFTESIAPYRPPILTKSYSVLPKRESAITSQTQRHHHRYSVVSSTAPTQTPKVTPRPSEGPTLLVPSVKENEKRSGGNVSMVTRVFSLSQSGIQKMQPTLLSKQSESKMGGEMKNGRVLEARRAEPSRPPIPRRDDAVETKRESAITAQTPTVAPVISTVAPLTSVFRPSSLAPRVTDKKSGEPLAVVSFSSPTPRSTSHNISATMRMKQFRVNSDGETNEGQDSSRGEALEGAEGGGIKKETVKRKSENASSSIPPAKAKRISIMAPIHGKTKSNNKL